MHDLDRIRCMNKFKTQPFAGPDQHSFVWSIDYEKQIITIQGINYAFSLFNQVAFAPKGARFEIGERSDGAVTLYAIDAEERP